MRTLFFEDQISIPIYFETNIPEIDNNGRSPPLITSLQGIKYTDHTRQKWLSRSIQWCPYLTPSTGQQKNRYRIIWNLPIAVITHFAHHQAWVLIQDQTICHRDLIILLEWVGPALPPCRVIKIFKLLVPTLNLLIRMMQTTTAEMVVMMLILLLPNTSRRRRSPICQENPKNQW